MVRAYILTENEREIIAKYLKTGEKASGFYMLISRLRTIDIESLSWQVRDLKKFCKKISQNEKDISMNKGV